MINQTVCSKGMKLVASPSGFGHEMESLSQRGLRGRFALVLLGAILLGLRALAGPAVIQTFFVPFSEDQLFSFYTNVNTATSVGSNIVNVISITVAQSNTVVYFDQYEDGYEADAANPTQSTTLVWGDGITNNGVAPGTTNDLLRSGAVIVLQNTNLTPRSTNLVTYGGRDKISASGPIACSYISWSLASASSPSTLIAEGVDLYDTSNFGLDFISPLGTNVSSSNALFNVCQLAIMPAQDATTVRVDSDANGTFDSTNLVNAGSGLIIPSIRAGARVSADKPVQCHVLTAVRPSSYATRWYTIYPPSLWDNEYFNPVMTRGTGHVTRAFLYSTGALTVVASQIGSTNNISLAAGAFGEYEAPTNSGSRFTSSNSFYAVLAVDSGGASNALSSYDWGCVMVPADSLTPSVLVGWAPGSDFTSARTNSSPVWVTAVSNTTLLIDYDGNPTTGALVDGNGNHYDTSTTITALQVARIFDTNDSDMTGARIYSSNGVKIAAAYGEDPQISPAGNPGLDAGTTIQPLPVYVATKTATLTNDANGNGKYDPGDQILYRGLPITLFSVISS